VLRTKRRALDPQPVQRGSPPKAAASAARRKACAAPLLNLCKGTQPSGARALAQSTSQTTSPALRAGQAERPVTHRHQVTGHNEEGYATGHWYLTARRLH
jgi:hypothetical protein